MRRWLALILIAMLPLRALAGDVMAVQMLAHAGAEQGAMQVAAQGTTQGAAQAAQAPAAPAPSPAHEDCHGHAATPDGVASMASNPPGSAHTSADPCEGSCLLCQVCHSAVILVGEPGRIGLPLADASPAQAVAHYASASIPLGQKPPIS